MKLINTNRFFLNVLGKDKQWLHLATVQHGFKEYMCFADVLTGLTYIEEVTLGTGPNRIEDDLLADELEMFLVTAGVLSTNKPLLPDNQWLKK